MPGYEFRVTFPLFKRIRDQAVVNVNMASHTSAPDAETRYASLSGVNQKKSRIWFLNEINIIVVDKLVTII